MTYMGRLSSKGVYFSGVRYSYERLGISQVEVLEKGREICDLGIPFLWF